MRDSPTPIHFLDSVDSTNNYAMTRIYAAEASHGSAYFAHEQTAGKGQRGNNWYTGRDENIALSIVLVPASLKIAEQFRLSVAVALGSYDFFKRYAGEETAIKWPNDLYWRNRKAGGILIENIIGQGDKQVAVWKYAVAGIGININQSGFDPVLSRAVSLRQITGISHDIVRLADELYQCVMRRVGELKVADFAGHLAEYNQCLFGRHQTVRLKKGNIEFETCIQEVLPDGRLFTTDRIDNYFSSGEVEWVFD